MSLPVILFVATDGPQDISIARREPDGTLRRAEYANINWLDRLSGGVDHLVSLEPYDDLYHLNARLKHDLARTWEPRHVLNLTGHVSGYYTAMKRYHGSDRSLDIAGAQTELHELSESLGIPVQAYAPEKNSTNRLNWTIRLWERTNN